MLYIFIKIENTYKVIIFSLYFITKKYISNYLFPIVIIMNILKLLVRKRTCIRLLCDVLFAMYDVNAFLLYN